MENAAQTPATHVRGLPIQSVESRLTVAEMRDIILDVLDEGWQCAPTCDIKHPWSFPTEMFAGDRQPTSEDIELRMKFTDAVIKRALRRQEIKGASQ